MSTKFVALFYLVLSNVALGKEERIIGGVLTDIKNFPFMASLRHFIYNTHLCGGAIISPKDILTAAHCVFKQESNYVYLRIQVGITSSATSLEHLYEIDQVFPHPHYTDRIDRRSSYTNDIAVIKIRRRIEFNEYQSSVSLPTRNAVADDEGVITGWGITAYPSRIFAEELYKAGVTIVDRIECQKLLLTSVKLSQFCGFKATGIGPCDGDSGGPMTRDGQIVGIISFSVPCAEGFPDVYTNVYSYLDFIRSKMDP